jgi:hypothetical protein
MKMSLKPVFNSFGLELVAILPIKKEDGTRDRKNVRLILNNGLEMKFPNKLETQMGLTLYKFLKMKNFAPMTNYLIKNTKSKKITDFLKKVHKKAGPKAMIVFERAEVTTKGYYFVLFTHDIRQPIMLDWNGKVLSKKQGKMFGVVHTFFT